RIRWILAVVAVAAAPLSAHAQALPGTKLLEGKEDFAKVMVQGIGKWLDRETAASVAKRKELWKADYTNVEAYRKSVQPNRERLRKILGLVDERLSPKLEYVGEPSRSTPVATANTFKVYAVRWAVLPGVDGEGLLFEPNDGDPSVNLII